MGWTTKTLRCYWRQLVILLTPILFLPLAIALGKKTEVRCGYVILVMAVYWVTEAVPLPVTGLIPVFGFPLLGVLSTKDVCAAYMKDSVMLFLGALMLAVAIATSRLDRRVSLFVLLWVGKNLRLLMGGFMMTTMLLSMWMNNAAATALMIPILDSILDEVEQTWNPPVKLVIPKITITDMEENKEMLWGEVNQGFQEEFERELNSPTTSDIPKTSDQGKELEVKDKTKTSDLQNYRRCLYLSIAYGANIGGTGVITGSAPNMYLIGILNKAYTRPTNLNFMTWMAFNIPTMLLCTFIGWIWLQYQFLGIRRTDEERRKEEQDRLGLKRIVSSRYQGLGSVTLHEGIVLAFLLVLFTLWVFRQPSKTIGWAKIFSNIYGDSLEITDASSVMLIVFILFIIPSQLPLIMESKSTAVQPCSGCLTWQQLQNKIPWGVLLLFGSGFAIAEGANQSDLSFTIAQQLEDLQNVPLPVLVFLNTLFAIVMTNVASNNATASILLPILNEVSLTLCSNPLYLMLPVTICCSYAFLLPVATAPNAMVYYAGKLSLSEMMWTGLGMNTICFLIINIAINTYANTIFNLDELPAWINSTTSDKGLNC